MASPKLDIKLPNGLVLASARAATPIHLVSVGNYAAWLKKQNKPTQNWLSAHGFQPRPQDYKILPDAKGNIAAVILCYGDLSIWSLSDLARTLPTGAYKLIYGAEIPKQDLDNLFLGWCLGAYQFTRYKTGKNTGAVLQVPKTVNLPWLSACAQSLYLVRDMINTPAEDMGPEQLQKIAQNLAKAQGAKIKTIVGDDLIKQNYPLIHAVGRAGPQAPRLIDLRWGNPKHKKLTLVGKGVAFDTGGLDIKSADGMLIMKKDMGGAAHALALAHMIMQLRLPVQLRVLIAAVENSIASNAFRPLDIFKSRKGITVEIGNTDAEGRLILSDCLTEACSEDPDLLVDFATLTGAARVALGPELPAMFSNQSQLQTAFVQHAMKTEDPLWPMPLWKNYRSMLDSKIADINNSGNSSFAGAITAALFLQEFVKPSTPWIHLDVYGWNPSDKPGRPQGGEAMTIRGLFSLLQERYKHG